MKKIVFVCYGNVTRSPACRTVLKQMLVDRGIDDVDVDSAGIASFDGEEPDHWMFEAAIDRRYIIGGKSKRITSELVQDADLVICMEHGHVPFIQKEMPYERWNRIRLFNELCFDEDTDLADPTGMVRSATWECLDRIEAGCQRLVEMIVESINV